MNKIQNICALIGRAVLSLDTANKLGQVHDVIIEPISGRLAGFSIQRPDQSVALVPFQEVHHVGDDALMVNADHVAVPAEESPLKDYRLGKNQLIGVKVITEQGKLMGNVANIYLHLSATPLFIYEVRSSILDKLLGHSVYVAASSAEAFSDDGKSLIVSDDPEVMDRSLAAAARRLLGYDQATTYPVPGAVQVTVRSRAE